MTIKAQTGGEKDDRLGGAGRTVWVVEPTDYDMYGSYGIYDSLEAAKASCPWVKKWVEEGGTGEHRSGQGDRRIYRTEVQTLADLTSPPGEQLT